MKAKVLINAALFLTLSAFCVVGYLFLLNVLRDRLGPFSSAVPALVLMLAALAINRWFLIRDGRSMADLGFDAAHLQSRPLVFAFISGCLLVGVWMLLIVTLTSASWRQGPTFDAMAGIGAFAFAAFNNTAEELVYRGYLFLVLANAFGRGVAVIATCTLFTILHIQAGIPWPNAVAVVLTSSLIYAALFIRWQSVPIVAAFHVSTNVVQEFMGLRPSGLTLFVPSPRSNVAESHPYAILAAIGIFNIALALAIFFSARRRNTAATFEHLSR